MGNSDDPQYVNPLYHTGATTWAPSGATFYDGSRYPQWKNRLFIATLRGKHLRVVTLTPDHTGVESTAALYQDTLGRIRDVAQGPDGYLYLCTSNRDGRGDPGNKDDLIVRIIRPP